MTTRKVTIQALDIISVGKLQGTIFAAVALVFGLIIAIVTLIGGVANERLLQGILAALAAAILLPLVYGIAGFITGLIGGLIYNFAAQTIGGISLKFTYDDDVI